MTCTTSEWSLLNESTFFPCCGRMAKFLPSGLIFEICHPGVARSTNRAVPVATVILFLETQRAVGDGKGACGLAILCQNQVVFRTRTRPTIHLARFLVTTTVWGRVAQVSPYGSRITARLASSFFPKRRFLTKWLMCSDIMVKKDLPLRGSLRNEAREMTACKTHPDCPSLTT